MIASIIVGVVGIVFVILGWLIWKKDKISLLHEYHYNRVAEEDKKVFCTLSGIGVLLIGIGLLITAIVLGITNATWSFAFFGIGMVVGLIILIYAGIRYN